MPAKPVKPPIKRVACPQPVSDYWTQSRRPLAALAFVLPLLVLYEGGVVILGRQAVRNGADVWLRQFLDYGAMKGKFAVCEYYDGDLKLVRDYTTHAMKNRASRGWPNFFPRC